jgi:hypothetical protein
MSCRMLLRWRSGSSMMRWRQSRSISTGLGGGIDIEELKQRFQNSDINWFPGHMVKATKRIEERIQAADLVGFSANFGPHPHLPCVTPLCGSTA